MKHKKFLSILMALAMAFSVCVSAFAAASEDLTGIVQGTTTGTENDLGNTQFTATATVTIPDIEVVVPSTGTLFINPMGFELVVMKGEAATGDDKSSTDIMTSSEQIISPAYVIENKSPMKLQVLANPLATVTTGTTTIASTAALTESTKNEVFIYAQFDQVDNTVTSFAIEDITPASKVAYTADGANAAKTQGFVAVPSKALKDAVEVGNIVAADNDNGSGFMTMQFFGACAGAPKADWDETTSLTVAVAFTFKPIATPPASSGT